MEPGEKISLKPVILVVSNVGDIDKIEKKIFDHGDAHAQAEEVAKALLESGGTVEVYRRVATYKAKIEVEMTTERAADSHAS
jgi:hypothetical protein